VEKTCQSRLGTSQPSSYRRRNVWTHACPSSSAFFASSNSCCCCCFFFFFFHDHAACQNVIFPCTIRHPVLFHRPSPHNYCTSFANHSRSPSRRGGRCLHQLAARPLG